MQHDKVTFAHLKKQAYLYVRQSTLRQVLEHSESTKRQYALKERAVVLGWPLERIITIDDDLGCSGAESTQRCGFQRLVSEVGMDKAGVVMGLEVSRLARNSADWHRLLEICALTNTLILDEDGIYNPSDFNDRLILGLKGTMSEAELHLLKSRLQGGIVSKAKRGELKQPLPTGLMYNAKNAVILDPDSQVQEALKMLFNTFERLGSATATVRYFRDNTLRFPRRIHSGMHKGELTWCELTHWKVLQVLHNPRYAGAFCYGRGKQRRLADGSKKHLTIPLEEWTVLIKDAHPGYIPWQQYERHLQQLKNNAQTYGHDRRRSPPREGPALLQGLISCGRCGDQMTLRYASKKEGRQVPMYLCQREGIENASDICQCIPGEAIDHAISHLILDSVTPLTIDIALKIQQELEMRANEVILLHQKQVARARYEADLARTRFMKVDPANRLVADTLEAEWNEALRTLETVAAEHEQVCKQEHLRLNEKQQRELIHLSVDFPKLWNNPATSNKEKKRIVRLVIEDVTLTRGEDIRMAVRFKGGATTIRVLPLPQHVSVKRKTDRVVVNRIDALLDAYCEGEVADILNQEGLVSGTGSAFSAGIVYHIRETYGLRSRTARMRKQGYLTAEELAQKLGVTSFSIIKWARLGVLPSFNKDSKSRLYKIPDLSMIDNLKQHLKPSRKSTFLERLTHKLEEVQYEV